MIREGTILQVENLEKIILGLGEERYEILHDGSKAKGKMFSDQDESKVFYKLIEVYTEPTGYDISKLITVKSGIVRLYYDYRDGSGLVEMGDRDYGHLWEIKEFRKAVEAVRKNGIKVEGK